ncbi:AraC family transcriptional regulator [Rathayibacter sp. AY1B5]|jgi:AraC-like DNA-binding protein|uniref:helix-turn-helix transcriptional regulator n=1 Tax=Rathayibacter sp. AY1B5 TaxID=2080530 RepID=UPI001C66745E|nr:AraC family transcriptional regulator [Rathayibacter sp. AY1B5]
MGAGPALQRFTRSGADLEEARRFYSDGYGGSGFRTETVERPFSFRYDVSGSEGVSLRTSVFRGSVSGGLRPEGEYIVSWFLSGTSVMDPEGDRIVHRPGWPVVFPSARPFEFVSRDFQQRLVHVAAGLLEQVASESGDGVPLPLVFDHRSIASASALPGWWRAVDDFAGVLRSGREATALQLVAAERGVALHLLATFAHRPVVVPAQVLRPGLEHLLRAAEFLHAFAASPITVADIAAAAGLTPRALQAAFRRHFDDTPLGYLRGVRLDRARVELREGAPGEETVRAVSARWGFLNQGRFSGAYHRRFGEYPVETLRR